MSDDDRDYASSIETGVEVDFETHFVRWLLESAAEEGFDVNAESKLESGKWVTSLIFACAVGHPGATSREMAVLLLDRGADINQAANNGRTPLFEASVKWDDSTVELLLDRLAARRLEPHHWRQRVRAAL